MQPGGRVIQGFLSSGSSSLVAQFGGVKKLDLPRSLVPRVDIINSFGCAGTMHQDAILDLLRSTGRGLGAEQCSGEGRRGVPPPS